MALKSRTALALLLVSMGLMATCWRLAHSRQAAGTRQSEVLSHFMPHAGGCAWYTIAVKATGKIHDAQQIVVLPSDCEGLNVTIAPDGQQALVWFDSPGTSTGEAPAAFLVDIDRGVFRRLPAPDLTDMVTLAFTKQGKPAAFGFEPNVLVETDASGRQRVLRHGGASYPAVDGPDGIDALAIMQVWREGSELEDSSWQTVSKAASRCCGDAVLGLEALDAFVDLERMHLTQRLSGPDCADTDAINHVLAPDRYGAALTPFLPPSSYQRRSLVRLARPDWNFALLAWRDDPRSPIFGPLSFEHAAHLQPLPMPTHTQAWPADVRLDAAIHGPFLLISENPSGTQPLLFDMRDGRLIWSERMATGTCFWPPRREHAHRHDR